MRKTIKIGEQSVTLEANGKLPRFYRERFGQDIILDMALLKEKYDRIVKEREKDFADLSTVEQFSIIDLTTFENIAYSMSKLADPDIPDDVDTWLEGLEMLSIYEILPHVVQLWGLNKKTLSKPKKK